MRSVKYYVDRGVLLTPCSMMASTKRIIKVGSNQCAECKSYVGRDLLKQTVLCSHPDWNEAT